MLKLSLSMTLRDWRAGELRFLVAALALAVASLSAVQFFTSRMGAALQRDAHQLLAADLRLARDVPLPPSLAAEAARAGLQSAQTVELNSMASTGQGEQARAQLVSLKAVSPAYPLRGTLTLSGAAAAGGPAPGAAWIDPVLLASLGLRVGDTVQLGDVRLTVAATITAEPDRSPLALMAVPRVMIGMADLRASGLVQSGSQAAHRLLLAGEARALAAFEQAAQTILKSADGRGVSIDTLASTNREAASSLGSAARFLSLVGALSAMLAALAVAMAARRFMLRHADASAMLRCLGMPLPRMLAMFAIEFALVGVAASAAGVLLGLGAHLVLVAALGDLMSVPLPPVGWMPALQGMGAGVLLLAGFALPPLLQMRAIPHNRLLRGATGSGESAALSAATTLPGLASITLLLVWQAGQLLAGLYAALALVLAVLLFAGAARLAIAALAYVPAAWDRGVMRLALADLRRRPGAAITQVVALSLGLMALLLLTVVRSDLLESWKHTAPAGAPNQVVYNILPEQHAAVSARLAPFGKPVLHPLIKGRLTAINGRPVDAAAFQDERAARMVERELDISSAAVLPPSNTLAAGRWPGNGTAQAPELSVSQRTAARLGVQLGDRMTIQFAGQPMTARVTSLRKVDARSRETSFPFLLNPAAATGLASGYVTSFHVPERDSAAMQVLAADFPNLTMLDIGAMIVQFQRLLEQAAGAVEFLFLFTLASGAMVLYATLMASHDERARQAAVLRALGASRAQLARVQRLECALTGMLAGLLAAAGAAVCSWALARFAFDLAWSFTPLLPAAGMVLGALCALLAGLSGLRTILSQSPLLTLRA